jgi:hypothetical protein
MLKEEDADRKKTRPQTKTEEEDEEEVVKWKGREEHGEKENGISN